MSAPEFLLQGSSFKAKGMGLGAAGKQMYARLFRKLY